MKPGDRVVVVDVPSIPKHGGLTIRGHLPPGTVGTVIKVCSRYVVFQDEGRRASQWHADPRELAPAPIEYGPGTTRHGFMPGDRVQHVIGDVGTVEGETENLVRVVFDPSPMHDRVRAERCIPENLRLIDSDTGDPTVARKPVPAPPPSTGALNDLGRQSFNTAVSKGFYAELDFANRFLDGHEEFGNLAHMANAMQRIRKLLNQLWVGMRIALIHSEVSEMLEAFRDGQLTPQADEKGKPIGLPSELADVYIRLADFGRGMGIDQDTAVATKAAYNATRPPLHGKVSGL